MLRTQKALKIPFHRFFNTQQNTVSVFKSINFDDTQKLYQSKSLFELLKSYLILKSCPVANKYGSSLLRTQNPIIHFLAKKSYFSYFCGGETIEECIPVIKELNERGMKAILGFSVEGEYVSEQEMDAEEFLKTHHFLQFPTSSIKDMKPDGKMWDVVHETLKTLKTKGCSHGVIKLTGIADCRVLLRLTEILHYVQCFPNSKKDLLPQKLLIDNQTWYLPTRTPVFLFDSQKPPERLNNLELKSLDDLLQRMYKLLDTCVEHDIPLLVDAEQSYYQAAIDYLAIILSLKYNKEKAYVMNTYQMYMKHNAEKLRFDAEFLRKNNVKLGAKIVRGGKRSNHESFII